MRSPIFASLTVSALFCLVAAPAGAHEAPASVPLSNTAPAEPAPKSVPASHVAAAAAFGDSTDRPAASKRWSGWQTLTADAASIGLIAVGVSSRSDAVAFAGIGSLALTPAVIHLAHGSYGSTGWSVAARAGGVPLAAGTGYLIGHAACSPASNDRDVPCEAVTANIGLLGAAVFAIVLDSAILGYEPAPKDEGETWAAHPRRADAALHLVPSLSLSHDLSLVTLSGDF